VDLTNGGFEERARTMSAASKIDDPAAGSSPLLTGLVDRAYALRDHVLADPRFHRLMSAFPLTRPIVRNRARALFDICAGFTYTQVLLACVRLRLFDILAAGPLTVDAIADQASLSPEAASRLLNAAAALGLVSRRGGGRFGLGMAGAALRGNPGVAEMVEHNAMLYADLVDPVALLRGDRSRASLAAYWSYAKAPDPAALATDQVGAYSALMSASQSFIAPDVLAAWPFERHRHLLDIGGGEGAFISAVAGRAKNIRLTLFDLPPVAVRAGLRFAAEGLAPRAEAVGGDFFADDMPRGADIASLVRIVHDHDDAAVLKLLSRIRDILPPGGTLLIAEPMSAAPGGGPIADAYFGLFFLAMGSGRPRTKDELSALLRAAGFSAVRAIATRRPLLCGLLAATK
jgi:demethylspheroidene O-methyltransferase